MLVCTQLRIYSGMLLTQRWVRNKRMVPTADHNTPQRVLSRQIVAGRSGECKKIILRPFLAHVLTLKTVLQSAPQHSIFIQKIEKFSGKGAARIHHSRRAFGTRPLPPLHNRRYITPLFMYNDGCRQMT